MLDLNLVNVATKSVLLNTTLYCLTSKPMRNENNFKLQQGENTIGMRETQSSVDDLNCFPLCFLERGVGDPFLILSKYSSCVMPT